jgi:tRNA A37 threonylcarbamoyladenosine dehydratase
VAAVFSTEQIQFAAPAACDPNALPDENPGIGRSKRLDCVSGYGTAVHVTAVMGLFACERVLQALLSSSAERDDSELDESELARRRAQTEAQL